MGIRAGAELKHKACLFPLWQHMKWPREQPRCPAVLWGRDKVAIIIPLGDNGRQYEGLVDRCETSTNDQQGVTSFRPSHPLP